MAPKEIVFSPNAEKELKKMSAESRKYMIKGLEKWSSGDSKPEIEKIKSQPNFFRLRLGSFRVVYYPMPNGRVVILLIRDRKSAYADLGSLPVKLETAMRKLGMAGL